MSAESIRIINAAISRTQGNTITSVDDGSPEAIYADQNYEQMVQTALSESNWKFARKTDACVLLPDAPTDSDYAYAWTLPDDVLSLRTVIVSGQPIDYQIDQADTILTNFAEDVYAVYTYRVAEDQWPYDFKEGLTIRLEAAYLRLDDRTQPAELRDQAAERRMARARLLHSQEEAPKSHSRYPLIEARRTGSAPSR